MAQSENSFDKLLRQHLELEISAIANNEAEKAIERLRQRVTRLVGEVSLSLLRRYEIERVADKLIIKVDISDLTKNEKK